jgi:FMN phosphatase YigB (HAD superfamily)
MINKPTPESFLRAMALCGESDAAACVTVDDALRNLLTANSLGMTTVLVGRDDGCEAVDFCIGRVAELTRAMPALLEAGPASQGGAS